MNYDLPDFPWIDDDNDARYQMELIWYETNQDIDMPNTSSTNLFNDTDDLPF